MVLTAGAGGVASWVPLRRKRTKHERRRESIMGRITLWRKHILARYSATDSNGSKSKPNGIPVVHPMIAMRGMTKRESRCLRSRDCEFTTQKNPVAYDRRTDGNSVAQPQLILDRDVDGGHTVYRRIHYNPSPARGSRQHTRNRPHSGQQNESRPLLADVSRHHQPIRSPSDQLQRIRLECLSLM